MRLARIAFGRLGLDELRFVPALASPLKAEPAAPPEARLAMLREMLAGTPFAIEGAEMEGCAQSGRASYTVDTLEKLSAREPDAAWILVMGMDQAANFDGWRDPERILELASVAAAARPGWPDWPNRRGAESTGPGHAHGLPRVLASRISGGWSGAPGQAVLLPSTDTEASSSRLRERMAAGAAAAQGGLCEGVRAVISEKNLYRQAAAGRRAQGRHDDT
jgi:nicotinate (nicotinamide) nucleotide adenylyltransferase